MSKITAIRPDERTGRFYIYLDGHYAARVSASIFPKLNLSLGMDIERDEIERRERQAFSENYQKTSGAEERISCIISFIESIDPQISVMLCGGDLTKRKTDLILSVKGHPETPFMFIEISGLNRRHGTSYWLRPSKLNYLHRHPRQDVWAILAYEPDRDLVFLRLDAAERYPEVHVTIKGAPETYVEFSQDCKAVRTTEYFVKYVKLKLERTLAWLAAKR